MMLYKNPKVKVCSPDGVLQEDTLAPNLFIICLDYVLWMSMDLMKENGITLAKARNRWYPAQTIINADCADDIALLVNTPTQAKSLLHSLERAVGGIGLHVNTDKTEFMRICWRGSISTINSRSLKLVDKFIYLRSSISSMENDISTQLAKAWTTIDMLLVIWKSDLSDKIKCSFFQAVVTSILLYGCITWMLTKRIEKRLDGNCTRMLRTILNKSWWQHTTKQLLYSHLPPISKTIQIRWTRYAEYCWRGKDKLISDILSWPSLHRWTRVGWSARTYIQQLCTDTRCSMEDLPGVMNDRRVAREGEGKEIRASSIIWWSDVEIKCILERTEY